MICLHLNSLHNGSGRRCPVTRPARRYRPAGDAPARQVGFGVAASAMAETLRIRGTPAELPTFEATAKAKKQTVSEWIRSTLNAAMEA
jgi:hypothetical protein